MYRSIFLLLAAAEPLLAQSRVDDPPVRPNQFSGSGPTLNQPREESLRNRVREFNQPVSIGLVVPRPPEEANVDMEAVLRQFYTDEERLARDEVRLRGTIRKIAARIRRGRVELQDSQRQVVQLGHKSKFQCCESGIA